jgi:aryl-alcohol dehydrogenase-like predicted oxidoreductase
MTQRYQAFPTRQFSTPSTLPLTAWKPPTLASQKHRFVDETPIEETVEALHDLIKASKVRYIGASSMWATQLAQLQFCAEKRGWTKIVSMQNYYNMLYTEE